jgi:hypothetical protein
MNPKPLLIALTLAACGPLPSTDKPLNAEAALAILGAPASEVYAVDPDPSCTTAEGLLRALDPDPNGVGCFGGMTLGSQVWLAWYPGVKWSESSMAHEALHRRGYDHPPSGWAPDSAEGRWVARGNEKLRASKFDAMELR